MSESLNGTAHAEEQPLPRKPDVLDLMLQQAVGPMLKDVFGEGATKITIKKAMLDSRFKNHLLFDSYVRQLRIENMLGQVLHILSEASSAPVEQSRVIKPF